MKINRVICSKVYPLVRRKVSRRKERGIVDDKKLFLEVLSEIIDERKKTGQYFHDIETDTVLSAEKYFESIFFEMKRLCDEIFYDKSFIHEQFGQYDDFSDYINDIIDDIVKEDSMSMLSLNYIS